MDYLDDFVCEIQSDEFEYELEPYPFYWEEDKFIKELKEFMEKNCVVDPAWENIFEEFFEKGAEK